DGQAGMCFDCCDRLCLHRAVALAVALGTADPRSCRLRLRLGTRAQPPMSSISLADWLQLFGHFLLLSLVAIGGALVIAPEMHRLMVTQTGMLNDAQFSASIAIAQAAPGPNVLFVAVMGYQAAGIAGAAATMIGIMLPSSVLALTASR